MLAPDDLLNEVLLAPRTAARGLPDTRFIDRPGWYQVLTPSLPQGLNEVVCSALPAAEADRIIDDTLAEYRLRGIRGRWSVPPGPGAAELATRLVARGLTRDLSRAMWRPIDAPDCAPAPLSVMRADVDAFTEAMAQGWKSDPAPMRAIHLAMSSDPQGRYRFHVARHEGRAVGAAATVLLDRSAYLMGAVVPEDFRGRGAYRALVSARLREAFAEGRTLATSLAREATSAPILEHLGFQTAASIEVFRF